VKTSVLEACSILSGNQQYLPGQSPTMSSTRILDQEVLRQTAWSLLLRDGQCLSGHTTSGELHPGGAAVGANAFGITVFTGTTAAAAAVSAPRAAAATAAAAAADIRYAAGCSRPRASRRGSCLPCSLSRPCPRPRA